jgi:hypothetical protein
VPPGRAVTKEQVTSFNAFNAETKNVGKKPKLTFEIQAYLKIPSASRDAEQTQVIPELARREALKVCPENMLRYTGC